MTAEQIVAILGRLKVGGAEVFFGKLEKPLLRHPGKEPARGELAASGAEHDLVRPLV